MSGLLVSNPPTPTLHSPPGLTLADGTEFEDLSPEDRPSCVSLTAPTLLSIVNVLTGNVIVSNTSSLVVSWPRNFVVNASLAGKYGCDADGILSNSSFILRVVGKEIFIYFVFDLYRHASSQICRRIYIYTKPMTVLLR